MHRAARLCLAFAAALPLSCATPLALEPAPTAAAPLDVRTHYYETHALQAPERGELELRARLFSARPTLTRTHGSMASGTAIRDVTVLAPLVDEGSPTRTAIDAARSARSVATALYVGGASVAGAGLLASATMLALTIGVVPDTGDAPAPGLTPLALGAGASFIGGTLLGGGLIAFGTTFGDDADDATTAAFGSFNDDLRARLALADSPAPAASEPASPASPPSPTSRAPFAPGAGTCLQVARLDVTETLAGVSMPRLFRLDERAAPEPYAGWSRVTGLPGFIDPKGEGPHVHGWRVGVGAIELLWSNGTQTMTYLVPLDRGGDGVVTFRAGDGPERDVGFVTLRTIDCGTGRSAFAPGPNACLEVVRLDTSDIDVVTAHAPRAFVLKDVIADGEGLDTEWRDVDPREGFFEAAPARMTAWRLRDDALEVFWSAGPQKLTFLVPSDANGEGRVRYASDAAPEHDVGTVTLRETACAH